MPPKKKKTSSAKSDKKEVDYNIGTSVRRAVLASVLESKIQLSLQTAKAKKAEKKMAEEAKKAIEKKEKAAQKAVVDSANASKETTHRYNLRGQGSIEDSTYVLFVYLFVFLFII
jgi:hypothetical protein